MMNRALSALPRLARASSRGAVPSATLVPASSNISQAQASSGIARYAVVIDHHQCRRSLSSKVKTNTTAAAADRRLAGRRRFYKHVGIAKCSPPTPQEPTTKNGDSDASTPASVASPISAGVDGTQSATGVNTTISDTNSWSSLLTNLTNKDPSSSSSDWHTVTLDNRPLRTPLGLPLTLPSSTLALVIASEWDAQLKYLQPAQMPLMTLACTAIDQVASNPAPHQTDVLRYLMNDTSCYWACPTEDRVLHKKQSKAWDGLHTTVSQSLLGVSSSDLGPAQAMGGGEALLLSRSSEGNPNSGLPHPPILVDKAQAWVNTLDAWTLTALYSACAESKSFFIGAGLIHDAMKVGGDNDSHQNDGVGDGSRGSRDAKWAANASRVEEEFNIECWGLVEGGHDYDRVNCSIQMHAASFLAQTVRL